MEMPMRRVMVALAFAAMIVLAVGLYWQTLGFGKIWEDSEALKVRRDAVTAMVTQLIYGIRTGTPADDRPAYTASLALDRAVWGSRFAGFHFTNVLIHMLVTLSLAGLAWSAFRSYATAVLSGLLVAVQPAQVMATAWVGARTDGLCALGIILFAWCVVCSAQSTGVRRAIFFALSGAFLCLASLAKEMALPAVLLAPIAFRCWGSREGVKLDRAMGLAAVVFALAVLVATLPYYAAGPGAPLGMFAMGPMEMLRAVPRTLCYYFCLLLVPAIRWCHTLSLGAFVDLGVPALIAGTAIGGGAAYALWRTVTRRCPLSLFVALTCLSVLVVSNITPAGIFAVVASRAAVPGVGIAVIIAHLLVRLARKGRAGAICGGAAAVAVAGWWSSVTIADVPQWRDQMEAVSTIVREDPDSTWAMLSLCYTLEHTGKHKEALAALDGRLTKMLGSTEWRTQTVPVILASNQAALHRITEADQCDAVRRLTYMIDYGKLGHAPDEPL